MTQPTVRCVRAGAHPIVMAPPLDLRALVNLQLADVERELDDEPLGVVEGELPTGLAGTLYRNGPGRFGRGAVPFDHPFDGDGHVVAVRIADGQCSARSRFVNTREIAAEQAAGRVLYRGFGTQRPGGILANAFRMQFRNAANTNIVFHAGQLRALWEGGTPHLLDRHSLATLGEDDLAGLLAPRGALRALGAAQTFSAHPRHDAVTGELWNFGLRWGIGQSLVIYALDVAGRARVVAEHSLRELSFIHDMALTSRFVVIAAPAVHFDVVQMLFGMTSPVRGLHSRDGGLALWLIPRTGGAPTVVPGPPGFAFHLAGAYDLPDGRVVCDLALMPGLPDLADFARTMGPDADGRALGVLTRMVFDPIARSARTEVVSPIAVEMPATAVSSPHPYTDVWAVAAPPGRLQPYHSALVRITPEGQRHVLRDFFPALPSEPILVPRPGARDDADAWLLTFLHHPGAAAELLVLDAATLETQARARFPIAIPPGLHGSWVDGR
ncbi:carotenoid oxygenase family protein [soil metagenome]